MTRRKKQRIPVEQQLHNIVSGIIKQRSKVDQMPPGWVARQALTEIGLPKSPLVSHCALEHLKQLARAVLRTLFEPDNHAGSGGGDLFAGFQSHYPLPVEEGEEPTYRLFILLTPEQLRWNAARLRSEAKAKNAHADALDGEADKREASAAA